MKRMKKLLAVLLAVAMVMTMGSMSVLADGNSVDTYSITINNSSSGRVYQAYQIFTGTLESGVLTDIAFGTGVYPTNESGELDTTLLTKDWATSTLSINITVGETTYQTVGALVSAILVDGSDGIGDVANFLYTYGNMDENVLIAFAETSYKYRSFTCVTSVESGNADDGYTYTMSGLAAGYYLIVETTSGSADAISRYMLYLTSNTAYESKEEAPSLTKTLENGDTSTSASVGGKISYKLTSAIPDTTGYNTYTYIITDTIDEALKLTTTTGTVSTTASGNDLSALDLLIKITVPNTATEYTPGTYTLTGIRVNDSTDTSGVSSYPYYYYTTEDGGNTVLTIVFNSMITLQGSYGAGSDIVVTYSAELTSAATIGAVGNENKAHLTYSNNPTGDGTGTTDTTDEKVVVYSYELDFTKKDGNDGSVLDGAEFVLSYTNGTTTYYATATGTGLSGSNTVTASSSTSENTYKITGWTQDKDDATKLISGTDGVFKIAGLGDGTYSLEETKAPTGYNTWESAKTIVIESETTESAITSLSATVDEKVDGDTTSGAVSIDVTNTSSSALPTTGGIGTTIFYIVGALLVLGAGVLLITRRRMASR